MVFEGSGSQKSIKNQSQINAKSMLEKVMQYRIQNKLKWVPKIVNNPSKMQSTNNENSGVVNKLTNLVSRNRKEN